MTRHAGVLCICDICNRTAHGRQAASRAAAARACARAFAHRLRRRVLKVEGLGEPTEAAREREPDVGDVGGRLLLGDEGGEGREAVGAQVASADLPGRCVCVRVCVNERARERSRRRNRESESEAARATLHAHTHTHTQSQGQSACARLTSSP
jgi:hypothetical protein